MLFYLHWGVKFGNFDLGKSDHSCAKKDHTLTKKACRSMSCIGKIGKSKNYWGATQKVKSDQNHPNIA